MIQLVSCSLACLCIKLILIARIGCVLARKEEYTGRLLASLPSTTTHRRSTQTQKKNSRGAAQAALANSQTFLAVTHIAKQNKTDDMKAVEVKYKQSNVKKYQQTYLNTKKYFFLIEFLLSQLFTL